MQRKGSAYCKFESDVLPTKIMAKVISLLGEAKKPYDLQVIFDAVKADLVEYTPIVKALNEATQALRESNG